MPTISVNFTKISWYAGEILVSKEEGKEDDINGRLFTPNLLKPADSERV